MILALHTLRRPYLVRLKPFQTRFFKTSLKKLTLDCFLRGVSCRAWRSFSTIHCKTYWKTAFPNSSQYGPERRSRGSRCTLTPRLRSCLCAAWHVDFPCGADADGGRLVPPLQHSSLPVREPPAAPWHGGEPARAVSVLADAGTHVQTTVSCFFLLCHKYKGSTHSTNRANSHRG